MGQIINYFLKMVTWGYALFPFFGTETVQQRFETRVMHDPAMVLHL